MSSLKTEVNAEAIFDSLLGENNETVNIDRMLAILFDSTKIAHYVRLYFNIINLRKYFFTIWNYVCPLQTL